MKGVSINKKDKAGAASLVHNSGASPRPSVHSQAHTDVLDNRCRCPGDVDGREIDGGQVAIECGRCGE